MDAEQLPERPAGLPEGSVWNGSIGFWELSSENASGVRDGECLQFRADGTLYRRSHYVAGLQQGDFVIYHPNGAIAREGHHVDGHLDGLVRAYAAVEAIGGELLRPCCVPPGAARLDILYRRGDIALETFFDPDDHAILSDGSRRPERPTSVPEQARFDETRKGWAIWTPDTRRFWSGAGSLREEEVPRVGGGQMVRLLDEAGRVVEERELAPDGLSTGPYRRRFTPGTPAEYADARVREERGAFERGQAIGTWTFLDEAGDTVLCVERGFALSSSEILTSPAFAPELANGGRLARRLLAERRVREALVTAARAAARDRDRGALLAFIEAYVVARPPENAIERGEALVRSTDADAPTILDGLVQGADAASAFRALAAVLPGSGPAAHQLIEAALLLAPERPMAHFTRALIRIQRGDEPGALADAAAVEAVSPESAASLRLYARVVFRPFEFWPAQEAGELAAQPGGQSLTVAHDLPDIRRVVGVYATRLARVRQALEALPGAAGEPAWMPPDTSALLPDGPVALRRERISCEADDGSTDSDADWVEIDEEVATAELGAPGLLALAHADYGALAWLCWAVGLTQVALPARIDPPATFEAALRMIIDRHYRASDQVSTGGLMALSRGARGFAWYGIGIDTMPRHLAMLPQGDYLAVRSMFLWLGSHDALTPFEDDLQKA